VRLVRAHEYRLLLGERLDLPRPLPGHAVQRMRAAVEVGTRAVVLPGPAKAPVTEAIAVRQHREAGAGARPFDRGGFARAPPRQFAEPEAGDGGADVGAQ